ncbi:CPBP family intramembrane glutamic endopeptidase [Oceanobacillus alkalisoli]|uniref:CPBP family intramembrane glutamic endopeptidase n=1 Tax=Oceanobacillus alkalisoli TaxID=2925113 RepID=UPI001EEFEB75|nr:type II CAAX endopeptidase family protein [Oceanobacillus alkalisoli]MCF3944789.1 CPBP family intramembrane metalloprotease [Oceanobacillus alkalisoli]MCG5105302.1 CPBP family intramembrane metalloprotease [Oceanobacillus alkalisoli]
MQLQQMNWKKHDYWGWKEFVLLMLVEFGLILGVVKPFIQPIYSNLFENDLYSGTLSGLTMAIILILSVYFIALRPRKLTWKEVGIEPFAAKDWKMILVYSAVFMVGAVVIMTLTSLIGNTWENEKTDAMQQNRSFFMLAIAFISAAIISPIYEEIFYRGFIYRWLRTRIGLVGAILLSSIIFTVVHIPTYNAMPVNFLAGIIFAYAYERSGSIWPAVLIHGITNGVMVLLASL